MTATLSFLIFLPNSFRGHFNFFNQPDQSDLDNKFNRSFIESALEKAIKNISKNGSFTLEAVVDRDTYGIPGSPSSNI